MSPDELDAYNTRTALEAHLTELAERITRLEGEPQSPTIDGALVEARRQRNSLRLALQLAGQPE